MAISNAAQFGLLLWKNWLLQKRRIVVTVFQIMIPALFSLILLIIRVLVKSQFEPVPTRWNTFEAPTSFHPNLTFPNPLMNTSVAPHKPGPRWRLVYSPKTSNATIRMATNITQMLDAIPIGRLSLSLMFNFSIFCR